MTDFADADLAGARFERVDLSRAEFVTTDMAGARFRCVDLSGAVLRGACLNGADLHGEIDDMTVNGVAVGDFVNAELDRRHPGRAAMRPTDADGFRRGWDVVAQLWDETTDRARQLDPALLNESVDGEWSFIETLRHLLFATDSWIRRVVLGDPAPWHSLDLPWDEMPDTPAVPRDRAARPSLETVVDLRRDRMGTVRAVLDGLTDEVLDTGTTPIEAPGWPKARSYPLRECLLCILNEEWEHRLYAERDLEVLTTRTATRPLPTT